MLLRDTRGGGVPKARVCGGHTNFLVSYHMLVNAAVSYNYALFCTTARRLLQCFQSFAHSFVVDRGWGGIQSSFASAVTLGASIPCALTRLRILPVATGWCTLYALRISQSPASSLPSVKPPASRSQNRRHFDFFFTHRHVGEYSGATTVTWFGKSYVTSALTCADVLALSMRYSYSTVSGSGCSDWFAAKVQEHRFSFAALTSAGGPAAVSVKPNRPSLYTRIFKVTFPCTLSCHATSG